MTLKLKEDHYLKSTSENVNDPSKCWQVVKDLEWKKDTQLPKRLLVDTQIVTERTSILKALNQHFLDAGSLFEKVKGINEPPVNLPDTPVYSFTRLSFSSSSVSEVCKALKEIDRMMN
jgi:hypothetical protein